MQKSETIPENKQQEQTNLIAQTSRKLLEVLGLLGNIGLLFAVCMYVGSEKQRRDTEVFTAWQTITSTQGQSGNGGRIKALEFLNASPRNQEYGYAGANWRRRAICLWLCTWPTESLDGIDLSVDTATISESDVEVILSIGRVFLKDVQLPNAKLGAANLAGADLRAANLKGAYLWNANLKEAYLGAVLRKDFSYEGEAANLERAYLEDANLEGAYLGKVNLSGANP